MWQRNTNFNYENTHGMEEDKFDDDGLCDFLFYIKIIACVLKGYDL
jgi:hypothetical protein